MLYSKTCEYAIRALAYIASQKNYAGYTSSSEVKKATGVPGPYLSKVFGVLVRKEVLNAKQGPGGGVAFARSPKEISLLDIISSIETTELVEKKCIMGLSECSAKHACPMHDEWGELKRKMVRKLSKISIFDIAQALGTRQFRELSRAKLKDWAAA